MEERQKFAVTFSYWQKRYDEYDPAPGYGDAATYLFDDKNKALEFLAGSYRSALEIASSIVPTEGYISENNTYAELRENYSDHEEWTRIQFSYIYK